jgi:hypothetical protein
MKFISKKVAVSSFSFSAVVLIGAAASMTNACTINNTDTGDGGIIDNDSGEGVDAGGDAATSASLPFQPSNVLLSAIDTSAAATADVSSNCQIQTDGATDCFPNGFASMDVTQSDSSKAHVIVVTSLTVEPSAKITVTGGLPLILISIGDIHLNGSIDANAAGSTHGPGGFTQETTNAAGGGPGGGGAGSDTAAATGGSYCGLGGAGAVTGGSAAAVPAAYGAVDLRPLAGGSSGGNGAAGGAGAGGGGIQIVSGGSFTMAQGSYINVGGGGGNFGGDSTQNAGGGGTGGSILIEATTVSLSGILAANGGGGGAGGGGSATSGGDATPNSTPAPGGTNSGAPQSAGGAGGAASVIDGLGGGDLAGSSAGGGGGGAGRIRINTSTGNVDFSTASISPTPGILTDGGTDVDGGTSSCVTEGIVRAAGSGI